MQDQQQQQRQGQNGDEDDIHYSVTSGIGESQQRQSESLYDSRWVEIISHPEEVINRASVRRLVNYLQGDDGGQPVTGLRLFNVHLSSPSDGGLDVLCDLVANTTRLGKVVLHNCDFGGPSGGTQVLESFHNNRYVTDLTIANRFCNLEGAALGTRLSHLLHNNRTLKRLVIHRCTWLGVAGFRALQPGFRSNQTLTILSLYSCRIGNEGLGLIADSLVGNTTLRVLGIDDHDFTPNGMVHIATLLRSTHLQEINLERNYGLFDAQSLQRLRDDLLSNHDLLRLRLDRRVGGRFPHHVAAIKILLARNEATSILAVQPGTGSIIPRTSGVWLAAISKWATRRATDGTIVGANAIFIVFQNRPILLDRTIPLPPQQQQQQQQPPPAPEDDGNDFVALEQEAEQPQEPQLAVAVQELVLDDQDNDDRDFDADAEGLDHHHHGTEQQPAHEDNDDDFAAAKQEAQDLRQEQPQVRVAVAATEEDLDRHRGVEQPHPAAATHQRTIEPRKSNLFSFAMTIALITAFIVIITVFIVTFNAIPALRECRQLQHRINRLGHSTWQNEIRGHLFSYVDSEGANRAAFTRAVNRLRDYEQRLGIAAVEQQQDHLDKEQPQQNPPQQAAVAAARHHQAEEDDDMNDNDHDGSSNNDRTQRCIAS